MDKEGQPRNYKKAAFGTGAVLAGAISAVGCADNQVGGIDLVDCENGPRENHTEIELLKGKELTIGGPHWHNGPRLKIKSEGGDDITIVEPELSGKVNFNEGRIAYVEGDNLIVGGDIIDIYFEEGDVYYDIVVDEGEHGSTLLKVGAFCPVKT